MKNIIEHIKGALGVGFLTLTFVAGVGCAAMYDENGKLTEDTARAIDNATAGA